MNVTCPNCATVYRVDPAKVPEAGVRARCAVCSAVFAVQREGQPARAPEPVAAPADASGAAAVVSSPGPEMARAEPAPSEPPRAEPAPAARPTAPVAPRPVAAPVAPPAAPGVSAPRPAAPARPTASAPAAPPPPAPPPPSAAPSPSASAAPPPSAPAAPPPSRQAPPPAGARPVNPFLSQDPALKARRLARALISDMVVYHPAKRQEGLRDGTLKELFEEEIKKSWEEYSEQIGRELADSTGYFREALNEILAGGRQIF